jgi:hypothetical protein
MVWEWKNRVVRRCPRQPAEVELLDLTLGFIAYSPYQEISLIGNSHCRLKADRFRIIELKFFEWRWSCHEDLLPVKSRGRTINGQDPVDW